LPAGAILYYTTNQAGITKGGIHLSKLLLVRHGRTKLHRTDRFWGSTDVPLSDEGIRQAEQLGRRLAREKIAAVYTSTLSRARLTGEIIAARHRLDVTTIGDLCECNFGYIEGLTYDEIKQKYPDLAEELDRGRVVAFPGGENIIELDGRVVAFLERLKGIEPGETALIVSHGGPLRLLVCHLLGIGIEHWQQLRIDHASLSIVETFPAMAILNLLNDISHLKP
jgi:alpha-ribazole phosphatase